MNRLHPRLRYTRISAHPPSEHRKGINALRILLPIIVVGIGVYSSAKLYATAPEKFTLAKREIVRTVETVTADIRNARPVMMVYGTTVAGRKLELRSRVAGEVIATGRQFQNGGDVAKGERLLQISRFNYRGAVTEAQSHLEETKAHYREVEASIAREHSALRRANEQLAVSRRDLKRAVSVGRGNLSAKAVDDRRITVSQRFQAVETHEKNIAVLDARAAQKRAILKRLTWHHEQALQRLAETELTAPFDGYLIDVDAQVGRMLNVNDRVGSLIDKHRIDVRFTISKAQFSRLISNSGKLPGRKAEIRWRLGERELIYPATVQRLAATLSAELGGVELIARIDDASSPVPLRPGAFVEVHVPEQLYANVAKLPETSVYGSDTIFVVDKDRLAAREVEVIATMGEDLLIRGDIESGDRVMSSRLSNPKAGLKVNAL